MPAIFVSHSSLDPKAADDVKGVLAGFGFDRVFLDFDKVTGIGAGENWERRLYEELARSHAVVLILTPNWLNSKWCFAELQQARALGKIILPIVFSPLGDRYVLPEIQSIDLIDWKQEGLARLEQRLRAITHDLARGFRLEPGRPPYPGIHAFEAEDAAIYFGRDEETRGVIEKLDARRMQGGTRFLLVIGASGAGKSSLLKAGILPQLSRRRSQWLPLPVIRPEKFPLEALAKALAQQLGREDDWRTIHQDLSGPDAATRIEDIVKNLRIGETRAATILLPVDQFEELFTIADAGERASLLALLAVILDPARGLPLMMVATGRADVLQGLLETSLLAPLMDTTPLLPMPLDRVPLLVEGPATVAALVVERDLPERIMRDVESPEALPLLAYTLHLLNERSHEQRLTLASYLALGDGSLNPVQNAVRLGADEAIARIKPAEQEMLALRDAFIPHLVRLRIDDKRHVRQPAPLAALPRESERLIRLLIEARLLTARTERDGKAIVEVAHEALFSAWPTLKKWLEDEQEFLADIERLKGAYDTWAQAVDAQKPEALLHGLLLSRARDWLMKYPQRFGGSGVDPLRNFIAESAASDDAERERSRRLRQRIFQGMTAAVVILAAIAALAGWQYFQADTARREAEIQRGIAQQQTTIAEQQGEQAKQERKEAEQQRDRAERNFRVAKQAADDVVSKLALGLRNVAGMQVDSVRKILDASQTLMNQLAEAAPNDLELQRSRSAMQDQFVDTYLPLGDTSRARAAAEESVAIMRKLVAAKPANRPWQRDFSNSLGKFGDIKMREGDRKGALAAYEEGLVVARKFAASAAPDDAESQAYVAAQIKRVGDVKRAEGDRAGAMAAFEEGLATTRKMTAAKPDFWPAGLAYMLYMVGDIKWDADDTSGALAAFSENVALLRKLSVADPGDTFLRNSLHYSLIKIGDIRRFKDEQPEALKAYEESLAITRSLGSIDPGNSQWQNDISASLQRIGDIKMDAGASSEALAIYEESNTISGKTAASDPNNINWQRDVGIGFDRVGNAKRDMGDKAGALVAYEKGLLVRRKVMSTDPGNVTWQGELGFELNKVGTARQVTGDSAAAQKAFEESASIRRKLASMDANNAGWQRDLSISLDSLGDAKLGDGDREGALQAYQESLSIRRALANAAPDDPDRQRSVSLRLDAIGKAKREAADRPGALSIYEESLAIARKIAAAKPDDVISQTDLFISLYNAGTVSDAPGAKQEFTEALTIAQSLDRDGKLPNDKKHWPKKIKDALTLSSGKSKPP